jgi:hypothetical protein
MASVAIDPANPGAPGAGPGAGPAPFLAALCLPISCYPRQPRMAPAGPQLSGSFQLTLVPGRSTVVPLS